MYCKNCGKSLSFNEMGLCKKLINRGTTEFYCIDCLAENLRCDADFLRDRISYYAETGCTLFAVPCNYKEKK